MQLSINIVGWYRGQKRISGQEDNGIIQLSNGSKLVIKGNECYLDSVLLCKSADGVDIRTFIYPALIWYLKTKGWKIY